MKKYTYMGLIVYFILGFTSFSDASYSVKVTVNFPFASGHFDAERN